MPVANVSWYDANHFCMLVTVQTGKYCRLPTEAEWEYACRANRIPTASFPFYYGNNAAIVGTYGWIQSNSGGAAHPVSDRTKLNNGYGLYNMFGNVWEWCDDWYGTYAPGPLTDPKGAGAGTTRVVRGGSFNGVWQRLPAGNPWSYRSAARDDYDPATTAAYIGFRVVVDP
jgi:formylglycine-generating enzyme required for sulfatase activity